MELFALDQSTYQPKKPIIRKFDSLVWTERYQNFGDFKLVVTDDVTVLDALPIHSLVSHTETREIMIVEDHEVNRDSNGVLTTTITGRSFITFFESRVVNPWSPVNVPLPLVDGAGDTYVLHYENYIDPRWVFLDLITTFAIDGRLNPGDAIPNLTLTLDTRPAPTLPPVVTLKRGSLYDRVMELLKTARFGIRTSRPYFTTTALEMIIYDGDVLDDVVFVAQNQDFTEATYFTSSNKNKTAALVAGRVEVVQLEDGSIGASGLNRRVKYVEMSEDMSASGLTAPEQTNALQVKGLEAIRANPELDLLQCKISVTADPKYKIHYQLGDMVYVIGEFGKKQIMRVSEYILTVDSDGISGYPSLSQY